MKGRTETFPSLSSARLAHASVNWTVAEIASKEVLGSQYSNICWIVPKVALKSQFNALLQD